MVRLNLNNGVTELNEVRTLLEPSIAAMAAQKATEADIRTMQQAITAMDAAMNDADIFVEADLDFHLALARATQNPLITILIDPIGDLLREHRKRIFLVDGGPERGQYHHKRILETILNHDPVAARQAMCAHLEQVIKDSSSAAKLVD